MVLITITIFVLSFPTIHFVYFFSVAKLGQKQIKRTHALKGPQKRQYDGGAMGIVDQAAFEANFNAIKGK